MKKEHKLSNNGFNLKAMIDILGKESSATLKPKHVMQLVDKVRDKVKVLSIG